MLKPFIQRAVWSSNWPGPGNIPGGVIYQDNMPADAYYLPPIPEGTGDSLAINYPSGATKWAWSDTNRQWVECPDFPTNFWSWDWQERYNLDFADELNPVYVIKNNPPPVEKPEPEPEDE